MTEMKELKNLDQKVEVLNQKTQDLLDELSLAEKIVAEVVNNSKLNHSRFNFNGFGILEGSYFCHIDSCRILPDKVEQMGSANNKYHFMNYDQVMDLAHSLEGFIANIEEVLDEKIDELDDIKITIQGEENA